MVLITPHPVTASTDQVSRCGYRRWRGAAPQHSSLHDTCCGPHCASGKNPCMTACEKELTPTFITQDVLCAAHSHSIYGRTFCALGRKLDTITQDSCAFHNDHVLYDSFNGVVLAVEEGQAIAKALGDKKAALLINHGLLTVGRTIEETVFWFVSLEKCCHAQLMADAAAAGRGGETVKIGEEEANYTYKTVGTPRAGTCLSCGAVRRVN
jgi:hypothetical protein